MSALIAYVVVTTVTIIGTRINGGSGSEMVQKSALRCHLQSDVSDDESDIDCSVGMYDDASTTKSTSTTTTTVRVIVIPRGPFYDFVVNICQALLHNFLVDKVRRYFIVLSKSLEGLGSGRFMRKKIEKFSERLQRSSDLRGELLRIKVQNFLNIISSGKPMVNEFFHAMNAIYSVRDDTKMDDYIYLLKRYGMGKSRHIGDRTREIFEKLIFRVFYKQKDAIQEDIKLKFHSAYIEYLYGKA